MKPIDHLIPVNTWVDVRDPAVLADLVEIINAQIGGAACDDGIEVSALSRLDPDAPADLQPPMPGQRHLQVDILAGDSRLCFVVGVLGRPGSELLGFTPDELRKAASGLRRVISQLEGKKSRVSATSLATLAEQARMFDHPHSDPSRLQPIQASDFVVAAVLATPVEAAA